MTTETDSVSDLAKELLDEIDEMLELTAGHQIVSASEIADKLLDLRLIVAKVQ